MFVCFLFFTWAWINIYTVSNSCHAYSKNPSFIFLNQDVLLTVRHLDPPVRAETIAFLNNTPPNPCVPVSFSQVSHIWPAITSHWSCHSQTTNTSPHTRLYPHLPTTKSLPTHYSTVETQQSLWHLEKKAQCQMKDVKFVTPYVYVG